MRMPSAPCTDVNVPHSWTTKFSAGLSPAKMHNCDATKTARTIFVFMLGLCIAAQRELSAAGESFVKRMSEPKAQSSRENPNAEGQAILRRPFVEIPNAANGRALADLAALAQSSFRESCFRLRFPTCQLRLQIF